MASNACKGLLVVVPGPCNCQRMPFVVPLADNTGECPPVTFTDWSTGALESNPLLRDQAMIGAPIPLEYTLPFQ